MKGNREGKETQVGLFLFEKPPQLFIYFYGRKDIVFFY